MTRLITSISVFSLLKLNIVAVLGLPPKEESMMERKVETVLYDDLCEATCIGNRCTFTAKVDLLAGKYGYYTFEECGGKTNPTLAMEVGKTYTFKQSDVSNYYHPLGFAYIPDGIHNLHGHGMHGGHDMKDMESGHRRMKRGYKAYKNRVPRTRRNTSMNDKKIGMHDGNDMDGMKGNGIDEMEDNGMDGMEDHDMDGMDGMGDHDMDGMEDHDINGMEDHDMDGMEGQMGSGELGPAAVPPGTDSKCDEDLSCPYPSYSIDDMYLGAGKHLELGEIRNCGNGKKDFGLDEYKRKFKYPISEWADMGEFSVTLRFDSDYELKQDIFYYCHVHSGMSGRIKLVKKSLVRSQLKTKLVSPSNTPEIPYKYDVLQEFDKKCGTYGLEPFQLPNKQCPNRFVCGIDDVEDPVLKTYAECIEAMDCAMMAGMTTNAHSRDVKALFNHQMIPHHENAVNMAKALLKTGKVHCDDITGETDDCEMKRILLEIINNQNAQIEAMKMLLASGGHRETDDCYVEV